MKIQYESDHCQVAQVPQVLPSEAREMAVLKSERHHWWPESVSAFWKNEQGVVHWLLPDGTERVAPPKQFGVIGNGHHIKLSSDPNEHTVWDESFEKEFDTADSNFKYVIQWLDTLPREHRTGSVARRIISCSVADEQVALLVEGLVSLAVRSPMTREAAVSLAERFRGPLEERERNLIIGMNMRNMHRAAVKDIGTCGKFVALFSPDREFIFGDGFCHNVLSPGGPPMSPRILVPLTPHLSMLYARPMAYTTEPRFMTLVLGPEEVDFCNRTIQVYAKNAVFYANDRPDVEEAFRSGKHLQYDLQNPIDRLIGMIP